MELPGDGDRVALHSAQQRAQVGRQHTRQHVVPPVVIGAYKGANEGGGGAFRFYRGPMKGGGVFSGHKNKRDVVNRETVPRDF